MRLNLISWIDKPRLNVSKVEPKLSTQFTHLMKHLWWPSWFDSILIELKQDLTYDRVKTKKISLTSTS